MRNNRFIGIGILSAITASLCCIMPLLTVILGATGFASTFSWLEPARPFLIGLTIVILGFAWYQKLKVKKQIQCDCEGSEKVKFIQSKKFLFIITVFLLIILAFPNYAHFFYTNSEKQEIDFDKSKVRTFEFVIGGMTCQACTKHIDSEVNNLKGIVKITSEYEKRKTTVIFDESKTNSSEIEKTINSTGYIVKEKIEK